MLSCIQSYMFEAYIVLRIASQIVSSLGFHFLVQDKICLNEYNQTEEFCQRINEVQDGDPEAAVRDRILADATKFNQW